MTTDGDRPQDEGRSHKRRGRPSPATASLLATYHEAMRWELSETLTALRPVPQDPGLGLVSVPDKRPPLAERMKLWDLAIKLGRELGTAIEPGPEPAGGAQPARRRRARVDYGGT